MQTSMAVFAKLAFVILAAWVVLAGLGMTTMPGAVKAVIKKQRRPKAKGSVWATPVATAPSAEAMLAYPQAQVM